jgi:hypothetical protein
MSGKEYMNATIDLDRAEGILRAAIKEVKTGTHRPSSKHAKEIAAVILGSHLTYRYILVNGLLAKASNDECNPICLQAGAELDGAFDARSLCHKVLVPVERELLGSRLGGSNEPFLNKPARFQTLSEENAVRRGRDTATLRTAISVLNYGFDRDSALLALKDAIFFIFKRPSRDIADILGKGANGHLGVSLIEFAENFVDVSVEGETCALLAGVAFSVIGKGVRENFDVIVHPVNQSGASSNEVSDVDVYLGGELLHTAEVKDKDFTAQDVEHAVSKAANADHRSLIFLIGPRGRLVGSTETDLQHYWENKGFVLIFHELIGFFKSAITLCPDMDAQGLADLLEEHAKKARVKDETIAIARECLERVTSNTKNL